MTPSTDVSARLLRPGEPIEADLAAGETQAYEVEVAAGQYLRVSAEQLGADVSLHWFDPAGTLQISVDSPQGDRGTETVHAVAAIGGRHRLEVHEAGTPGAYSVRIEESRPATADDRTRVAAEQAFAAGEQLRREAKPEAAEERYEEALEGFRGLGEQERQAYALQRIGWVAADQGKADVATRALRQAATLFADIGNEYWQHNCLLRLGSVLVDQYEMDAAIEVLEPAAVRIEEMGEVAFEAGVWSKLADAYRWSGRLQEALDASRRARSLFSQLGQTDGEQSTWLRLGEFYLLQSEFLEAADSFQRAQEIAAREGWRTREAHSLTLLGETLARQGRPQEALVPLRRALEIRREENDVRGEAVTLTALGTALLDLGRTADAGERLDAALQLFHAVEDPRAAAMVIHKQGRLRYAEGDLEGSLRLHRAAASTFAAEGESQRTASARYGAALALHDQGRFWEAKEEVEAALVQAARLVRETDQLEMRTSYVAGRYHYWELYVDLLMHLHEKEPESGFGGLALAANEAGRARGLADLLQEAGADRRAEVAPELLRREIEAQQRLRAAEAARTSSRQGTPEDRQQAERDLLDGLAELRAVRTEIRRSQPLLRELDGDEDDPFGRSNLGKLESLRRKALEANTLLLVYALGEERGFVWVLTRDGMVSRSLPPRPDVEGLAVRLADFLHSGAPSAAGPRQAAAAAFSAMVLGPVNEALAATGRSVGSFARLAVVADGAMLYVPFAALPLPGSDEPLIREMEVIHLPSVLTLGSLRRLHTGQQTAAKTLAVLADPVLSLEDERLPVAARRPVQSGRQSRDLNRSARDLGVEGFARLPGTEREARALAGLVEEDSRLVALGFEASRETVVSGRLADYRILHFATHGVIDERHPELSGLVLALYGRDGQPQDGYFRLHEIYGLHLRARLVVLSACQTGLGRNYRGEGLVGLARGFMYAGAPRVVVSLWNVDDGDTAELMVHFYTAMLEQHESPAAALRTAQLALLDKYGDASPGRWAGFVVLGDWRGGVTDDDSIEGVDSAGSTDPPPEQPGDPLPIPGERGDAEEESGS